MDNDRDNDHRRAFSQSAILGLDTLRNRPFGADKVCDIDHCFVHFGESPSAAKPGAAKIRFGKTARLIC